MGSVVRGFSFRSASRAFINVASEAVNRLFDLPDLSQKRGASRLATAWPDGFPFEDAAIYQACGRGARRT
jgi:hypothetical protein